MSRACRARRCRPEGTVLVWSGTTAVSHSSTNYYMHIARDVITTCSAFKDNILIMESKVTITLHYNFCEKQRIADVEVSGLRGAGRPPYGRDMDEGGTELATVDRYKLCTKRRLVSRTWRTVAVS